MFFSKNKKNKTGNGPEVYQHRWKWNQNAETVNCVCRLKEDLIAGFTQIFTFIWRAIWGAHSNLRTIYTKIIPIQQRTSSAGEKTALYCVLCGLNLGGRGGGRFLIISIDTFETKKCVSSAFIFEKFQITFLRNVRGCKKNRATNKITKMWYCHSMLSSR